MSVSNEGQTSEQKTDHLASHNLEEVKETVPAASSQQLVARYFGCTKLKQFYKLTESGAAAANGTNSAKDTVGGDQGHDEDVSGESDGAASVNSLNDKDLEDVLAAGGKNKLYKKLLKPAKKQAAKSKASADKKSPYRYQICVVYRVDLTETIKCRRLKLERSGSDHNTRLDCESCDPATVKRYRQLFRKLLCDSPDFDEALFRKTGGFTNPKFWEINLYWGQSGSIKDNFAAIDAYLLSVDLAVKL